MDDTRETVGVVIGTFGDESWIDLAKERAVPSVLTQTRPPDEFVHIHGPTLDVARNQGAMEVETDWLIFLDADDELDERYVEEMLAGGGDLRQPSTLGVVDGVEDATTVLIPRARLIDRNFMVIGTMCRRSQFLEVGGFVDWPLYEDWELWLRLYLAGAVISACPGAIYRVHVNPSGRNNPDRAAQLVIYNKIRGLHARRFDEVGWT